MSDSYAEANQKARAWLRERSDKLEAENHRLRDANRQLLNLVLVRFGHDSDVYNAARQFMVAQEDLSGLND